MVRPRSTAFKAIKIQADMAFPPQPWNRQCYITAFGEHVAVVNDSPTEGEINIFYRQAQPIAAIN
jgi:hypothetical protein